MIEPDSGAKERMDALDALPPTVRQFLAAMECDFNAVEVLKCFRRNGERRTIQILEANKNRELRLYRESLPEVVAQVGKAFRDAKIRPGQSRIGRARMSGSRH